MFCDCAVLELRQYTLHPGGRDVLIELFDRHFHDGLEAAGMHVIGEFRDLDDPQRFVWIRGFRSMADRRRALTDFYLKSQVWKDYREPANATMIDSDDVLLLRPPCPQTRITLAATAGPSMVAATIYPVDGSFAGFFEQRMAPVLEENGARLLGHLETEPAENTFPQLPVREGENVFVWLASFDDPQAYRAHLDRLDHHQEWSAEILPQLTKRLTTTPQHLRLLPIPNSRLR